jgi:ABC-2 type transport system ATP-binding protein
VSAPTATPPSLHVAGAARTFAGRTVLDGVHIKQAGPGVVALIGANGSGKTTLLRCIAQAAALDAGTLSICGIDVEHADTRAARSLVGWAPHEPPAWRDDTVTRNLDYAARLLGMNASDARASVERELAAWQLEPVATTAVRRLSRGWAQRYSLARADLAQPPVLLLDEPTTGLDTSARDLLDAAIAAWSHSRVVVVATHERAWVEQFAATVIDLPSRDA